MSIKIPLISDMLTDQWYYFISSNFTPGLHSSSYGASSTSSGTPFGNALHFISVSDSMQCLHNTHLGSVNLFPPPRKDVLFNKFSWLIWYLFSISISYKCLRQALSSIVLFVGVFRYSLDKTLIYFICQFVVIFLGHAVLFGLYSKNTQMKAWASLISPDT